MRYYWNKPKEMSERLRVGWLYSGELGYLSEDGYLYIAERAKDIIIRGGENIACGKTKGELRLDTFDTIMARRINRYIAFTLPQSLTSMREDPTSELLSPLSTIVNKVQMAAGTCSLFQGAPDSLRRRDDNFKARAN